MKGIKRGIKRSSFMCLNNGAQKRNKLIKLESRKTKK